jgi:uncharacterized protein YjbI with pentapeptide repeats
MTPNKSSNPNTSRITEEEICTKAQEIRRAKTIIIQNTPLEDDFKEEAKEALKKEKEFWNWTGFQEKKLWDFLQLLLVPIIVPVFIAMAGFKFQDFLKEKEQRVTDNKNKQEQQYLDNKYKEEKLNSYLNKMSSLIEKGLRKSNEDSDLFVIAQTKTVVALQFLNSDRQHQVIQFLKASKLDQLDQGKGILFNAEMSNSKLNEADLRESYFRQTYLLGTDFTQAKLRNTGFFETNLALANFIKAQLQGVAFIKSDLTHSKLTEADLYIADFVDTKLKEVDFTKANLKKAIFLSVDLSQAKGLTLEQFRGDNQPFLCKVILPKTIPVNPDRDCNSLPKELMEKQPRTFKTIQEAKTYVDRNSKLPN